MKLESGFQLVQTFDMEIWNVEYEFKTLGMCKYIIRTML